MFTSIFCQHFPIISRFIFGWHCVSPDGGVLVAGVEAVVLHNTGQDQSCVVLHRFHNLVGAFSVIVKTGCGTDGALHSTSKDQHK